MISSNGAVQFILDEQYLSDPPGSYLGMSWVPTDFLPWLRNPQRDARYGIVGALRIRFHGSDDVFEMPCALTTRLCFQLDLVHLSRGVAKCLTDHDRIITWDAIGLRVGGVRIPHVTNARGLKIATVEVLAPFIEIVHPLHNSSGPAPDGNITRVLFNIDDTLHHACIPIAYHDMLADVEPAPAYRPPILGCPILGYGTLRFKFDDSNDVHTFRCALVAADWNAWTLSRQAILEHMYSDGYEQPHFTAQHLVAHGVSIPLVQLSPSVWATLLLPED